jgi:hypothetical protein
MDIDTIKHFVRSRLEKMSYKSYLGSKVYTSLVKGNAWWWSDRRYWASKKRLFSLFNTHRGERCFIIGNGPSLNTTDLNFLKDEITFGLNRIYLLFDQLGFATTYLVSVNSLVIEQWADDIASLPMPKFLSWNARDLIEFKKNMMFLTNQGNLMFQRNITEPIWHGATVTYVAMQIAYYLGFEKVILVGVDHSFATEGDPHQEVYQKKADPNHFSPNYFGKGSRWNLPDLETSEFAYRMAKFQFESTNRKIVDATIGGELEVFPKVEYTSLFSNE